MADWVAFLDQKFAPSCAFPECKRPKYNFIKNASFRQEKKYHPPQRRIFEGIGVGSSEELMADWVAFSGHEYRSYPWI